MKINHRIRTIAEWAVAVILGLSFVASGLPKIMPGAGMVRRFEAWGYSAEFATGIGLFESIAGVLVIFPKTRRVGAGLIALDMVGAVFTHLRTDIGSPAMAIVYLVLAILLATVASRVPSEDERTPDSAH